MSNPERDPDEVECRPAGGPAGAVEILEPRDVPLGGPRAMLVRRTLPQRRRSLIGAWCFLDHYGPDRVESTGGMKVAPHPHTGLQTVSWLFTGEIEHRDSVGTHAMVRPGEVNLMTGGRGISHSEVSTPQTTELHGAQLWVALPDEHRHTAPAFAHYAPEPVERPGVRALVFLGSLLGSRSPVETFTPLLGVELVLEPGAELEVDAAGGLEAGFEHGVLVDRGSVHLQERPVSRGELAYLAPGAQRLRLRAGDDGARLLLIGGPPFGEAIVMWWNFVGRTHDEVVAFRDEWQAQITADDEVVDDAQQVAEGRFGRVIGDRLRPIPAPPLPGVRLRERR